jgi:hypothetical protein
VEFVNGTDVLKGNRTILGTLPVASNGLWLLSSVLPSDMSGGEGIYRVTPRSNNGEGKPVLFTLIVRAKPEVDTISDIVLCNGSPLSVIFSGPTPNTVFEWTTDAAGISLGIPAAGSTAVNVVALRNATNAVIVSTITVTPRIAECSAIGEAKTFTVKVLPTPVVLGIANKIVENASTVAAIPFTGTGYTSFRWTNDNPTIGLATSGEGVELPSFTADNGGQNPVTARITVTPVYDENGYVCTGESVEFYILIASKPVIDQLPDRTTCEGDVSAPITTSGLPTGEDYYISWSGGSIIGLIDNNGSESKLQNIPSFTTTIDANLLNEPTVVTVSVVPHINVGGNDFTGDAVTFTYTVKPTTRIVSGYEDTRTEQLEFCAEDAIYMDVKATGVNLKYQWYKDHILIPGATSASLNYAAGATDHTTSGKYHAVVTGTCGSVTSKTYEILVKVDVLTQHWNDVLIVNCTPESNGGFIFSNFQWYRQDAENGDVELTGETKSYLYIAGDLSTEDTYYVVARTQYGTDYISCPVKIQEVPGLGTITVYPNPVNTGETITVSVPGAAVIHLVDFVGKILKTVKTDGDIEIVMPNRPGVYILQVIMQGQPTREFKIIVK